MIQHMAHHNQAQHLRTIRLSTGCCKVPAQLSTRAYSKNLSTPRGTCLNAGVLKHRSITQHTFMWAGDEASINAALAGAGKMMMDSAMAE
eukprot:1149142-Pelagomonas_calceolata.AAC.7